ncbi:pyrimidine/purine nucleoside phosphorylase [Acinetobacter shaoyimingii]|uniref:Pyrimidine/purine nucleoside phosphorylase n=1 Tax=Acinetobacter shaoyimingii TaxID=2715164 RepID=A0A6G8RW75_9GAMM|nr:pyrimidine/purine nucleoside phosphorylase [Acinetobacter shaoyimingii]NHB57350.1 pyrimidine/purine nucleoside phosphorylase [Acinetobacter shaoyimingii]QIO06048.1 pyrimidine/purine nucleoside phosphorylase [Acinetobacter shaoyimingii]
MTSQLDFVTIHKKPNVYFQGRSISYLIECKDGSKKTLGVLLPTEKPLTFETHVNELIEIISGSCEVRIGDDEETYVYSVGDSFSVPENSRFSMYSTDVVDYICHLG